ncbi:hypothetical protein [Dysgonomonas sp. 511]|uniref:hypothetical protein n=1 Tax=Dysgonomonas sp. 511 TaxID=2302930 RepID=UPI0013D3C9EC|nr:hypothetical protein [Dysgonomonas sp. 511]NDV79770.1 hypothetical protein [Dysgonomonas sp. 511]
MKKHFLIVLAAVLSLAAFDVSAQQKKRSSTSRARKKTTAAAPLTRVSAGNIIEMTNSVVDIYNTQLESMKTLGDRLERLDKSINQVIQNPKTSSYAAANTSGIYSFRDGQYKTFQEKAKLAPAFTEKAEIMANMTAINNEFEVAKVLGNNAYNYFREKKYMEDDEKYTNFIALRDTFYASYKKINIMFKKTMELSSAAGDRAELVVLKSHPLASVIIPMKKNLSAVSQMMAKCRDDKPDAEAIKADVATIRKSLEKDKVATPAMKASMKTNGNSEDRFNRFYEYVGETASNADKFLEYLDPAKEITDIDHVYKETVEDARNRHLKQIYNEISRFYKLMVHEYNGL